MYTVVAATYLVGRTIMPWLCGMALWMPILNFVTTTYDELRSIEVRRTRNRRRTLLDASRGDRRSSARGYRRSEITRWTNAGRESCQGALNGEAQTSRI